MARGDSNVKDAQRCTLFPCISCGAAVGDYHASTCASIAHYGPTAAGRTIDAKIERLRTRLKTAPIDANVKALLLGILDLLGDEL